MKQEEMSLVVDRDIISLSTAQESIYVADILEGSGLAFIISDYREILGAIDTEFLSKAVELVLEKTPAYRSRLELVNDKPFLKVFNSADWGLRFVDLSHAPSPEIAAREWMIQEWKAGFDLFNGPLIKFVLIKIGTERFFLFHCGHHIIVDGAGAYQFERNVLQVYDALVGGDKVEVIDGPNMAQNLEAAYLASENFEIDRLFWKEELSGIEPQQSLSGRLPVKDRLFHRERTLLSNEEVILLKKFCLDNKISLPRALVAFVSLYYARMTSQRDVIIELPVALRKSKADLSAVDMRSNAVFLRLQLDTTTSFDELLKIISVKMRRALKHQQYRWEYIQKEFGVDFNLALFSINILPSNKISLRSGIIKETHNFSNGPVRDFGITLYLEDGADEIAIDLDCNRALYSESETRVHLNRIHNFIVSLISVSSSDLIISLPLLGEAERKVVLQDFNATGYPVERATLPELFEAQVARSPEAIALIFGDEEVSYLELDQRANQLARYLISQEIGAEDIVAIALDRSVEMIVSILGVLKSGAAYLPLDPDYPIERLLFMLKDSHAKKLIATQSIYDLLLGEAGDVQPRASLQQGNIASSVSSSSDGSESDRLARTDILALDVALSVLGSEESTYKLHTASAIEMLPGVILVDDGIVRAELSAFSNSQISDAFRIRPITAANLAYVIYTSGTTGRPKGVGVIHSALCNFFESYKIASENKDKNIGCLNAGVGFDVAVWEVFTRLIQGNTIRLGMANIEDIKNLISDIKLHSIDSIYIPAGIVGLFNDFIQEDGCKLLVKEVLTGVESIRNDELHTLARCLSNPLIVNGYGPTECTICSTWLVLKYFENNRAVVSIGSPISNTQIYILDASLSPMPIGSIGELYIAGSGLARGYLGRAALTSESFIACPFGKSGARMYRTGDLARWREDGTLEYVGRSDHQVKIRGFRIELGEIESALSKINAVGQVNVQVREVAGEKRLVAYLVERGATSSTTPASKGKLLTTSSLDGEVGLGDGESSLSLATIQSSSSLSSLSLAGSTPVSSLVSSTTASGSSSSSFPSSSTSTSLPSSAELRAALLRTLPDYMVPSAFVVLEKLPLTANGKLDIKALPDPEIESDKAYRAPITPTEVFLSDLYAELTGASRVGLDDDFFALGGHSLLALRLVSKVRDELGVELPVRVVFEHPTVETLSRVIDVEGDTSGLKHKHMRITPGEGGVGDERILSYGQLRMLALDRIEGGTASYNMPIVLRLRGKLDPHAFGAAFRDVVLRHEPLRTVIIEDSGEARGRLIPVPEGGVLLKIENLSALPTELREEQITQRIRREADRLFDLSRDLMAQATLLRLGEDDHILIVNIHHGAGDGTSMQVFFQDLNESYTARRRGQVPNYPPLLVSYADHAAWQRRWLEEGGELDRQLLHWRQALDGAPELLTLPTDNVRSPDRSRIAGYIPVEIGAETAKSLELLAQSHGTTLFAVLMGIYGCLLGRLARQEDVVIGFPVAGRSGTEVQHLVGFFVNTLVLRLNFHGVITGDDLIALTKQVALDALSHQEAPFERLVDDLTQTRSLSHTPIFQASLALQTQGSFSFDAEGIQVESIFTGLHQAKFDVTLYLTPQEDGLISGVLEYDASLFMERTAKSWVAQFKSLTDALITKSDAPLSSLSLIGDAERKVVLQDFNATGYPVERATLPELFEAQVARSPEAIALIFGDEEVSYLELDQRANQLARYLISQEIGAEDIVAIALDRSVEMIVSILGVLKSGAAYLPLDPDYPIKRLLFMLKDSHAKKLIATQSNYDRLLSETGDAQTTLLLQKGNIKSILTSADGFEEDRAFDIVSAIETEPSDFIRLPDALLIDDVVLQAKLAMFSNMPIKDSEHAQPLIPDNLAYVIYTSGTTDKPKGVGNTHRGGINLVAAQTKQFNVSNYSRVLLFASQAFDASFSEWTIALLNGSSLIIPNSSSIRANSSELSGFISRYKVTHATLPPAFLSNIDDKKLQDLQTIIVAGEACSPAAVFRFAGGRRMINAYGPTETTVCATMSGPLDPIADGSENMGSVTIGSPILNTQIYVLDPSFNPVPIGAIGELFIAGTGLARGYFGRAGLTSERFIACPFGSPGLRMYRTGDLARWREDGNLEYIGRADHQIKLRGFRIELGEIESALSKINAVGQVSVQARESAGEKRLVAYVVKNKAALSNQYSSALIDQQIDNWHAVFDTIYSDTDNLASEAPDFSGWRTSYDGAAIPLLEMEEWRTETLDRLRHLKPKRVFEIGSGSGILLLGLAREVEFYVGSDFSGTTIGALRKEVERLGLRSVTLYHQAADSAFPTFEAPVDTIVINSVAQYFPSVDYFLAVLKGCIDQLKAGGRIFLGDLRMLPLLALQSASIEYFKASEDCPLDVMHERMCRRFEAEEELLFDPAIFTLLKRQYPVITDIELTFKRSVFTNEMSLFRYDVVIHVNDLSRKSVAIDPKNIIDAQEDRFTLESLTSRLGLDLDQLVLKRLSNKRLWRDADIAGHLRRSVECDENLKKVDLLAQSVDNDKSSLIDPEEIYCLAERQGYRVALMFNVMNPERYFDAYFVKSDIDPVIIGIPIELQYPAPAGECKDWSVFTNQPMVRDTDRLFVLGLRDRLSHQLPDYMIPSSFVVLDRLPLTANGKLDIKALPDPEIESDKAYRAPITPTEVFLSDLYAELTGATRVGLDDSFFALGGHSLLAMRLVSKVCDVLGVELPVRAVFEHPTVEPLARVIDMEGDTSASQLTPTRIISGEEGAGDINQAIFDARSDIIIHKPTFRQSSLIAPRSILLTGAGGFLGRFLLNDLLIPAETVYCLIRCEHEVEGLAILRNRIAAAGLNIDLSRVKIIPGDLASPNLGLSGFNWELLTHEVDAILHCGAFVHHLHSYAIMKQVNVGSTEKLLELALTEKKKSFCFVSTIGVASMLKGVTLSSESILPNEPASSSGYLLSKWVGEQLVARCAKNYGLPAIIARPGNITGSSITGYSNYESNHFWNFVKGCVQLGAYPELSASIEMVPVDQLAKAIVALIMTPRSDLFVANLSNPETISQNEFYQQLENCGLIAQGELIANWQDRLTEIKEDNGLFLIKDLYAGEVSAKILPIEYRATLATLKSLGVNYSSDYKKWIPTYVSYLKEQGFF